MGMKKKMKKKMKKEHQDHVNSIKEMLASDPQHKNWDGISVKKEDYFSKHVNGLIKNFFNDSASQFASFFTTSTNLTEKELQELRKIIDVELQKKKK